MLIEILFFGSLTDITATGKIVLSDIADTDLVKKELISRFPALAKAKYILAVNQEMQEVNRNLMQGDIVALMPPFSGG